MSVKTGYVDHFSLASLSNSAMSFLSAIKRGRRSQSVTKRTVRLRKSDALGSGASLLVFCGTVLLSRLLQTVRSAEASRCPPRMFHILFRL
jgi:hypothetical protein